MRLRWLSLTLVLPLMTGCQRGPETVLDDYLTRLERVLEVERPAPQPPALPSRPARAALQPPASSRVALLDPLSLKPCQVLPLIAEHNAPMGKLALPSGQYRYQRQLLHRLHRCDPSELEPEGVALRQQVVEDRTPQLAQRFGRMLLLSEELWYKLDSSEAPWQWQGDVETEQLLSQLAQYRTQSLALDYPHDSDGQELEALLNQVRASAQPASLHRSMIALMTTLDQASAMLAASGLDSCSRQEAEILPNLLVAIYGKRVQPLLAQVQRSDQALTGPLRDLLQPVPDKAFFTFYLSSENSSLRAKYRSSVDRHTDHWQRKIAQCGGLPGQQSDNRPGT